jgi:hypothetical protein
MLSLILNALKVALRTTFQVVLFPVRFLVDLLGGLPVPAPPPPPPPLADDEVAVRPDPARRWAREVRRWAIRRGQGQSYEPDVPPDIAAWLATLDEERTSRLASLAVADIHRLLTGRPGPGSSQSSSSSSASASASARSARRARDCQYSAADRQSHSR